MTTLTIVAPEHGSYPITASFSDTEGTAFTPKTLSWSLLDIIGTVMNGRDKVSLTPSGTYYTVVLQGDDLIYDAGAVPGVRIFYMEGTYDSVYGNDQEFRAECQFSIEDLIGYR